MNRHLFWIVAVIVFQICIEFSEAGSRIGSPPFLPLEQKSVQSTGNTVHADSSIGEIKAVLVKSWFDEGLIWDEISTHWSNYGYIQVTIDQTTFMDTSAITLDNLQASKADVVIISDPAGFYHSFSSDEIESIQRYLEEGHHLLGTYNVFQYADRYGQADNRVLAPLFGLSDTIQYTLHPITPTYTISDTLHTLFSGLHYPHVSRGWSYAQVPQKGSWSSQAFVDDQLQILAYTEDSTSVMTLLENDKYWSIYIASMPEFQGDTLDAQWLYNAITYRFGEFNSHITTNDVPLPLIHSLRQYPNPFNSETAIEISIPARCSVDLSVYDIRGRKVATILHSELSAGEHTFFWSAENYPSGLYLLRFVSPNQMITKKMILQK